VPVRGLGLMPGCQAAPMLVLMLVRMLVQTQPQLLARMLVLPVLVL
jgi:hypothetical protein